jgi:hypothetical protein
MNDTLAESTNTAGQFLQVLGIVLIVASVGIPGYLYIRLRGNSINGERAAVTTCSPWRDCASGTAS